MKKVAISRIRNCRLPERKEVIERNVIEPTDQLSSTIRFSYSAIGKHRNEVEIPLRKRMFVESGGVWHDVNPYGASDAIKARHWAVITSRISHAKDTLYQCIEVNPLIRSGVPVIKGTRVPVSVVLANLAADMSISDIADDLNLSKQTLVSIIQCLATVFDGPANEYDPARRMHKLEAINEGMRAGREDCRSTVPGTIGW